MQKDVLHEVATPLQLDATDWGYPSEANDLNYKEYTRQLRRYDRVAWQTHDCSYCNEPIRAGDWYEACVYVSKKPGQKSRVWVEKRHYPECPDRLREYEEEARQEWERHNKEVQRAARKAA